MTNKEAIKRLNTCSCSDYMREAINLAIKVLEERPQGECKCPTCIYNDVSSVEAPCSICCHAWNDMYEEA